MVFTDWKEYAKSPRTDAEIAHSIRGYMRRAQRIGCPRDLGLTRYVDRSSVYEIPVIPLAQFWLADEALNTVQLRSQSRRHRMVSFATHLLCPSAAAALCKPQAKAD